MTIIDSIKNLFRSSKTEAPKTEVRNLIVTPISEVIPEFAGIAAKAEAEAQQEVPRVAVPQPDPAAKALVKGDINELVEVVADRENNALRLNVHGETVLAVETAEELAILVSKLIEGLNHSDLRPDSTEEEELIDNLKYDLDEINGSLAIYNGEDTDEDEEDELEELTSDEANYFNDVHGDHELTEERIKEIAAPLLKRNAEVRESIAKPDFKGLGMEWNRAELGL